jgi:hypothetical protein
MVAVSIQPSSHPGRSDFPSPVGGGSFHGTSSLRCAGSSARSRTPAHPQVMGSTSLLVGLCRSIPVQCPAAGRVTTTANREPLCASNGVTAHALHLGAGRRALPRLHRSYRLMRQTARLPSASVWCLILRVFAGCVESLLPVGLSRRYLCDPCTVAWVRTPPRSGGAFIRFFPPVLGLSIGSTASARGKIPQRSFVRGAYFGAATIRLCSGSATRLAHSLLRRSGLFVPAAAGPYTPRCTHAVTGRGLRHRYVSESDN